MSKEKRHKWAKARNMAKLGELITRSVTLSHQHKSSKKHRLEKDRPTNPARTPRQTIARQKN